VGILRRCFSVNHEALAQQGLMVITSELDGSGD
jgi:hypothetical protein